MSKSTRKTQAHHPQDLKTAPKNAPTDQPVFNIQKIYVKNVSLEMPGAPDIFREDWQPKLELTLGIDKSELLPGEYEVTLKMFAKSTLGEAVAFVIELQQAGIFTATGFADSNLDHLLGSFCPNLLFPYAREVITDLANKGGFPPIYLNPVDFDALYRQQLEKGRNQ
jgi:preprotein translocase subunit SecB